MKVDAYFTGLTKRQTMLLLTSLTFGGSESVEALDFLAPDEAELLKHRAQEIVKVPRDKRVPLLVSEIKRLVTSRRGQLWSADPDRLAAVLSRERRGLVEVILRALPSGLADEVRARLPSSGVVLTREVRPEILNIVRWKLEEALARDGGEGAHFKFSDVALLQPRELLAVCDRLGVRGLGTAIAGLPDEVREKFLQALPPDQRRLAKRAVAALADRALSPDDAVALVTLHGGDKDPSLAIRSAGAQRLARACLAQSPDFAARVLEKQHGEFSRLLEKWMREERPRTISRGADAGRTDVVAELERLEKKGVVDKPVRLYPTKRRPEPPPPAAPPAGKLPGGKLLPPRAPPPIAPPPAARAPRGDGEPHEGTRRERDAAHLLKRRPPEAPGESSLGGAPAKRRDLIAERVARRAGAASSRVEQAEPAGPVDPLAAAAEARRRLPLPVRAPPPPRPTERATGPKAPKPNREVLSSLPRLKKPPRNSR